MNNDSTNNDFFCVKSTTEPKMKKKPTYGVQGIDIEYERYEGEGEWVDKDLNEQLTSTISRVRTKEMKDEERIYIVLGVSTSYAPRKWGKSPIRIFNTDVKNVINRLSAKILAYLNTEHNRLLVSAPLSKLTKISKTKRGCDLKYFHNVKRLSPLLFTEQVSSTLRENVDWDTKPKNILIQLMPNLASEIRNRYHVEITRYLNQRHAEPIDIDDTGFLIANLRKEEATALLETSNFVFRISEVPQGVVELLETTKTDGQTTFNFAPESVTPTKHNNTEISRLPIICLMDSGVNDIQKLDGLIVGKDGYLFRGDFDDGYKEEGHGTPISVLATYGQDLVVPKARIISYKIFSEQRKQLHLKAYQYAIAKYSNQTRIFLSSINFKWSNPFVTAKLDNLIQRNNICAVFSAGNIRTKQKILNYASKGVSCASYVKNFPVEDPSSAVNIMAVGAISKEESQNSISRINELAPFTKCGVNNFALHDCPKPEVVQNGGNYCSDDTCLALESFGKSGNKVKSFVGTSFSAPLLARNIAEVEAKYGGRIKNAETLKAIALSSAKRGTHYCMGFGETVPFTKCDDMHALVYSEGEIPLKDRVSIKGFYTQSKGVIKLKIPTDVCKIELFIVHSDNNYLTAVPCLNTYLKVYAYKEGNETSAVKLDNPDVLDKKSHMKVFKWWFTRTSMQGIWTFVIRPETAVDMHPEHEKNTTVRYGCAILLTSRSNDRVVPLSEELHRNNPSIER